MQGAGGMHFYDRLSTTSTSIVRRPRRPTIWRRDRDGLRADGPWFACDEARIAPDILCVGKALTGGYMTMGATLATEAVASSVCAAPPGSQDALPLMHGPTFMGNPLACAVAVASVSKLLKGGWWRRRVRAIEGQLCEGWTPALGLIQG